MPKALDVADKSSSPALKEGVFALRKRLGPGSIARMLERLSERHGINI
jgi:hypothetical protein